MGSIGTPYLSPSSSIGTLARPISLCQRVGGGMGLSPVEWSSICPFQSMAMISSDTWICQPGATLMRQRRLSNGSGDQQPVLGSDPAVEPVRRAILSRHWAWKGETLRLRWSKAGAACASTHWRPASDEKRRRRTE